MTTLKPSRVGNFVAVILPRDVLAKLRMHEGDTYSLTDGADGDRISAFNLDFARQMAVTAGCRSTCAR